MNRYFGLVVILFLSVFAQAQPGNSEHKERWEKYRSEKIAFLTNYLDLSPDEAQKFWPLYNQLENERWDAQKLRKELEEKVLEAKETMPDHKIQELTREFAGSLKKEAEMLVIYNEKFLKILPAGKVLKLYKGESEFKMHMFKKFRDKHKEQ